MADEKSLEDSDSNIEEPKTPIDKSKIIDVKTTLVDSTPTFPEPSPTQEDDRTIFGRLYDKLLIDPIRKHPIIYGTTVFAAVFGATYAGSSFAAGYDSLEGLTELISNNKATSIAILGTGLAGLAGYRHLRSRSKSEKPEEPSPTQEEPNPEPEKDTAKAPANVPVPTNTPTPVNKPKWRYITTPAKAIFVTAPKKLWNLTYENRNLVTTPTKAIFVTALERLKGLARITNENRTMAGLLTAGTLATGTIIGGGYWLFSGDSEEKPAQDYNNSASNDEIEEEPKRVMAKYKKKGKPKENFVDTRPKEPKKGSIEKRLLSDYDFGEYNVTTYKLTNSSTDEESDVVQTIHDKSATHQIIWQYFYNKDKEKVTRARKIEISLFDRNSIEYKVSDDNPISSVVLKNANENYIHWLKKSQERIISDLEGQLK